MKNLDSYKKLLKTLISLKHDIDNDCFYADLKIKLQNRISVLEVSKLFDIIVREDSYSPNYIKVMDDIHISYLDGEGRKISWSDNGEQPKGEHLYVISHGTGPYIFGNEYIPELFQEYFNELKSYEPKFVDTNNNSLYFCKDKAKNVHENYKNIFNKYHSQYKEYYDKKQISKLEKKLAQLKEKTNDRY